MEIGEILDRAKSANGIKTDMALADALGVGRAAVSAWRHGQRLPDPVQCATLAGLSGIPLAQVMGIVGEARAISREEKAVWRKLAGSVALLLCAIGFSGALPGKAYAVSVSKSEISDARGSMPIMSVTRCAPSTALSVLPVPRRRTQ